MRLVGILCILLASVLASCDRTVSDRSPEPCQVRVVWTESPQTRALIAWSTFVAGDDHRVYFDTIPRGGELERYAGTVPCQRNGRHSSDEISCWYHHADARELVPATTYWFVVASDDHVSRELHFTTAPADDVPITFLQGGDSRSDPAVRRSMNQRIRQLASETPDLLCLAHGGDYVWNGARLDLWLGWLDDHQATIGADGRMLPIVPARGNHESLGPLFDEVFGWPGGGLGKNWFATMFSPAVLLVTLNTETVASGPQTEFLATTAAAHHDVRWKLAQYHRPIFPAVKRPAHVKPHWQPIFDAERFDLICESDGHTLRRTVPILGDARHDDGVVYIGEGGLGVTQRVPDTARWFLQQPGHASSKHHVWRIRLGADTLRCDAIAADGEIVDSWTRAARDRTLRGSK